MYAIRSYYGISLLNKEAYFNDQYQSYFDDEGKNPDQGNTINLTGQAIALLSQTPLKKQAKRIAMKTKSMLFEKQVSYNFV